MRAQRWALCGGMLLAAGCVTHRGSWRSGLAPAPPAEEPTLELVLLANPVPEDRGARAVAEGVAQVLAEDRPQAVVWLGNVGARPLRSATPRAVARGPKCDDPAALWTTPTGTTLAAAVEPLHREGRSFAVPGVLDHRCGHHDALRGEAMPWQLPASHYVLRVHADGSLSVPLRCSDGGCVFTPEAERDAPALVDLVMIDLSPWLRPREDPEPRRRDELQVLALDALLTAVGEHPPQAGPPRVLVSSVPVEAAAEHGVGAVWPEATMHALPDGLQRMLVEGYFSGVLAAHDRSSMLTADLSDALKRADRAWLPAPMFQVGAGAMAAPNRRAAMSLRRPRLRQSAAYRAPVLSDHRGFAVVRLYPERVELLLNARRGRRWEHSRLVVPLRPEPHPDRTPSPHMGPCRDCPPIPANER